jgi:hypothetical protein
MKFSIANSLRILTLLLFCISLRFFYLLQQGDFEPAQVVSDLPNHPEWEFNEHPPLNLLNQTFSFLGAGDQCYAFLGEDGTTVLKLLKHFDANGKRILDPVLESYKIAYQELREETGLLYLHLNKTDSHILTMIDKTGFLHQIDLGATEYALQKKVDALIVPMLNQLRRNPEVLKERIHSLLSLIASRCSKGIADRDTAIHRNIGFLGHNAIALDIGSYFKNEELKKNPYDEIARHTKRLVRWLRKHQPSLLPFYEQKLALFESGCEY